MELPRMMDVLLWKFSYYFTEKRCSIIVYKKFISHLSVVKLKAGPSIGPAFLFL
jgi:hypothetical protein